MHLYVTNYPRRKLQTMPPEYSDQAGWYEENLAPHEPMIRGWLKSRYRNEIEVDDIVQESLLKS